MTEGAPIFRFRHQLRVRWAEVDLQRVVFFGHYYAYFDLGMTEYFRALGYPYPGGLVDDHTDLFIKHSQCDYHASARYDNVLDVAVRIPRIGRSSMVLALQVERAAQVLVTGEIVYVFADPGTRQSKPVPPRLREAINVFERG